MLASWSEMKELRPWLLFSSAGPGVWQDGPAMAKLPLKGPFPIPDQWVDLCIELWTALVAMKAPLCFAT